METKKYIVVIELKHAHYSEIDELDKKMIENGFSMNSDNPRWIYDIETEKSEQDLNTWVMNIAKEFGRDYKVLVVSCG